MTRQRISAVKYDDNGNLIGFTLPKPIAQSENTIFTKLKNRFSKSKKSEREQKGEKVSLPSKIISIIKRKPKGESADQSTPSTSKTGGIKDKLTGSLSKILKRGKTAE